jgi:hypothetical protein
MIYSLIGSLLILLVCFGVVALTARATLGE